jgi:dTDP-glucose 4,6-dehydratase
MRMVDRPVDMLADAARLRPEGSEVLRLLSDNSLARQRLGWRPQVSLDEGLALTVEWIAAHLEMYRVGEYEI